MGAPQDSTIRLRGLIGKVGIPVIYKSLPGKFQDMMSAAVETKMIRNLKAITSVSPDVLRRFGITKLLQNQIFLTYWRLPDNIGYILIDADNNTVTVWEKDMLRRKWVNHKINLKLSDELADAIIAAIDSDRYVKPAPKQVKHSLKTGVKNRFSQKKFKKMKSLILSGNKCKEQDLTACEVTKKMKEFKRKLQKERVRSVPQLF